MGEETAGDEGAFTRAEVWLARLSVLVVVVLVVALGGLFAADVDFAGPLLVFMVVNLVFGREVGMAMGSTLGLAPWLMFFVNVVQSLAMGLLVYLLLVYVLTQHPQGLPGRWARTIRGFADQRRKTIDRFGPPGLFLLMLAPFFSHPFVGALAGRLSGLSLGRMIVPIVGSTVVVAAVWAYSVSAVVQLLLRVWGGFGIAVTLFFVLVAFAVVFVVNRRRRRPVTADRRSTSG